MSDHRLRLSPAGIKAGVWIDTGQWEPTQHIGGTTSYMVGGSKITDDAPLIMHRDRSYSEAEARAKGWLL